MRGEIQSSKEMSDPFHLGDEVSKQHRRGGSWEYERSSLLRKGGIQYTWEMKDLSSIGEEGSWERRDPVSLGEEGSSPSGREGVQPA